MANYCYYSSHPSSNCIRLNKMLRTRCPNRRCFVLAVILSFVSTTIYLYSGISASPEDTGFPSSEFLSHWNASPHCGETVSRRIHLMYSTVLIPAPFSSYVSSWASIYPDFELHFWTDKGINQFLNKQYGSDMVHFFNSRLAHGVERSDVARLLIVNYFGGLYADLDVIPLKSALPLIKNHSIILTEEPLPHAVFLYDKSSLISNAVLYSRPCHPLWQFYFKRYPAYLQSNFGGKVQLELRRSQRYRAVYATGPIALDKLAKQYIEQKEPSFSSVFVAPPIYFQPKFDTEAKDLRSLWYKCLPLVRAFALTDLQRRYCGQFSLTDAGSMLYTDDSSDTYARHDFLHLGYWGTGANKSVNVRNLLPKAIVH